MPTYSLVISDDEDRVLRSWMKDPQVWLDQVMEDMLKSKMEDILYEQTEINPKKLDMTRLLTEVNKLTLPTLAEREALPISRIL